MFCHAFPPHVGGLESHADEFSREMTKVGVKIAIFTSDLGSSAGFTVRDDGAEIYRYPAFEIVPNFPVPKIWSKKFMQLWLDIKSKKFDLQITRTRFFLSSLFPVFYGTKRTPWLHIEHGSDFVKVSSRFTSLVARIYDELIGRFILNRAWRVVAISAAVKNFVGKFTKRDVPVIYRGMDFEFMDSCGGGGVSLDDTKIKLGFAGRLYKWKNLESSIKAVLKLNRNDVVFYIVGDGEDRGRLEKLYVCDRIVFLGQFERRKVISFLKNIDIYIHSSNKGGGLSTSLLEAIYCGCRVVASPFEGADEVVDFIEGGVLTDSSTITIEAALLKALNIQCGLLGDKKVTSFKKQFSWSQSVKNYNNIINLAKAPFCTNL